MVFMLMATGCIVLILLVVVIYDKNAKLQQEVDKLEWHQSLEEQIKIIRNKKKEIDKQLKEKEDELESKTKEYYKGRRPSAFPI